LETVEFDCARIYLIHLPNELLNINGHLEFFFNVSKKIVGVDSTTTARLVTHVNESVAEFLFARCGFVFAFLYEELFELVEQDPSSILAIVHQNHPLGLILADRVTGAVESGAKVIN
jgi:hypothetical protein